jgi:hypothetical protein
VLELESLRGRLLAGWLPVEVAVSDAHRHPSVGCIAAVHCPPGGVVGLLNLGGGSLRLVYQQVASCYNLAVVDGAQPIGYKAVQTGQVGINLLSCVLDGYVLAVTGGGAAVAIQIGREGGDEDDGPTATHLQETFQVRSHNQLTDDMVEAILKLLDGGDGTLVVSTNKSTVVQA